MRRRPSENEETSMAKVAAGITTSLDGYITYRVVR
jgi:hypothetical protein